jgi:hypothetical protein
MNVRYLTIVFLTIVFSFPLSAQELDSSEEKLMLFYANGMFNTYKEAKRSLDYSYLELLRQEKSKNLEIEYQVLENISEGNVIVEFLEVAVQYLGYQSDFQLNRFKDWYNLKLYDIDEEEESKFVKILDRFYRTVSYDQDLIRHLTQYEYAFDNGYKVMTIAHSQGNLYTEKAYKSFLKWSYTHGVDYTILSVGTPIVLPEKEMMLRDIKDPIAKLSDNFPDPGDLIKIDNKEIPELVVSGNLLPQTKIPYHSYLTYLYGSDSREMIQKYYSNSLDMLFPDESGNCYAYRFVLDKKGNENLFLGVYETSKFSLMPTIVISKDNPEYGSFGHMPALARGEVISTKDQDIYQISCDKIPYGKDSLNIMPGVWNNTEEPAEISYTEYYMEENPISGVDTIKTNFNTPAYSGIGGSIFSKDEDGTISHW